MPAQPYLDADLTSNLIELGRVQDPRAMQGVTSTCCLLL